MPIAPCSRLWSSNSRISLISGAVAARLRSSPIVLIRNVPWPIRKAPLMAGLAASTLPANSAKSRDRFSFFFTMSDIQWPTSGRRYGAAETPQLPHTTVVTPWLAFMAIAGLSIRAVSSCVCTSMKPGATTLPAASTSLSPRSVPGASTAAMRSPFMATSAANSFLPVPSATWPLRMTMS